MKTSIELRAKCIELSRELTGKKGNKLTAKEIYNNAVNSIDNAAFLSPLEFYRRLYNNLITQK
jgi:hypothetical protein